MDTPLFDRIARDGTAGRNAYLRLADGHGLTLSTPPGSPYGVGEVYLWPGLNAPEGDGWAVEDHVELWLTSGDDGPDEGRLFYEVPVADVRALIEEHGGEHSDQTHPDA
jgi:hypothetical protein